MFGSDCNRQIFPRALRMTLGRLFTLTLPILATAAVAAPPASHCTASEDTLFTCRMGSKTLSFCAAKASDTVAPAWIQYRFGRVGAVELVYPAEKASPVGHFRYSTERGGRWVAAVVQFSSNDFSYVLNAYGNSNIPESNASLLVVRPNGARKVLQCADPGLYAAAGLSSFESFRLPEVEKEFRR